MQFIGGDKPRQSLLLLTNDHKIQCAFALELFDHAPKMGGKELFKSVPGLRLKGMFLYSM